MPEPDEAVDGIALDADYIPDELDMLPAQASADGMNEDDFFTIILKNEKERKGVVMKNFIKGKGQKTKVLRAVSMLLAVAMVICAVNVTSVDAKAKKKKNIVILYFSATGTTRETAKKIQKATKGKLVEVKPVNPYTEEDLDYGDDDSRVTKEHESAKTPADSTVRPEISNLKAIKKAVKNADVVYIGWPIWWGEAPHIMYTLVENVSLKGKTVVPFSTSISSGLGSSAKHLKAKAKISSKTKWLKGRNFYDIPSQKKVNKWVKSLKY